MTRRMAAYALLLSPLLAVTGCGDVGVIRDGDEVAPVLSSSTQWTAGKHEQISVRLKARNKDGSSERSVGFGGIPANANPTATVTFYVGSEAQTPVPVPLDHRC